MSDDHGTPSLPSPCEPVAQSVAAPAMREQGRKRGKYIEQAHKRHLQVVELSSLGLSQKQIAEILGISLSSVSWHIQRERFRQRRAVAVANGWGEDE